MCGGWVSVCCCARYSCSPGARACLYHWPHIHTHARTHTRLQQDPNDPNAPSVQDTAAFLSDIHGARGTNVFFIIGRKPLEDGPTYLLVVDNKTGKLLEQVRARSSWSPSPLSPLFSATLPSPSPLFLPTCFPLCFSFSLFPVLVAFTSWWWTIRPASSWSRCVPVCDLCCFPFSFVLHSLLPFPLFGMLMVATHISPPPPQHFLPNTFVPLASPFPFPSFPVRVVLPLSFVCSVFFAALYNTSPSATCHIFMLETNISPPPPLPVPPNPTHPQTQAGDNLPASVSAQNNRVAVLMVGNDATDLLSVFNYVEAKAVHGA